MSARDGAGSKRPQVKSAGLIALVLVLGTQAVAAQEPPRPATILELPFEISALRGPGSEVALAVATSGLIPKARPKPASADPKAAPPDEPASLAVVWGERGGAVVMLEGETLKTTFLSKDAIDGFAALETPRGALSTSRRALEGPLSAYLTGSARGPGKAAVLTIRERQPVGVTAEPTAVPIKTSTVAPAPDAVFVAHPPRIAQFEGKPAILAVTASGSGTSSLVLVAKAGTTPDAAWTILARTPPQPVKGSDGAPLALAAIGDFSGDGHLRAATIREPDGAGILQLWSYAQGAFSLAAEAPGFAGPAAGEPDLAAIIPTEPGGKPELALMTSRREAVAVVSLKDGIKERVRMALPAPAATGLVAVGRGKGARLLVGLGDGRVAVVAPGASTGPQQ